MSDRSTSSGGGVGFTGLLAILFIYLKLTDQVDWSWVWLGLLVLLAAFLFVRCL